VQGLGHRYWQIKDMAALVNKVWGIDVNASQLGELWAQCDAFDQQPKTNPPNK
jgi:hypothetical protein